MSDRVPPQQEADQMKGDAEEGPESSVRREERSRGDAFEGRPEGSRETSAPVHRNCSRSGSIEPEQQDLKDEERKG